MAALKFKTSCLEYFFNSTHDLSGRTSHVNCEQHTHSAHEHNENNDGHDCAIKYLLKEGVFVFHVTTEISLRLFQVGRLRTRLFPEREWRHVRVVEINPFCRLFSNLYQTRPNFDMWLGSLIIKQMFD